MVSNPLPTGGFQQQWYQGTSSTFLYVDSFGYSHSYAQAASNIPPPPRVEPPPHYRQGAKGKSCPPAALWLASAAPPEPPLPNAPVLPRRVPKGRLGARRARRPVRSRPGFRSLL